MNEGLTSRKLDELLPDLYMKYAKSTIVARSMVLISGLKPVQQRVLYSMHELKAENGTRRKSARIVGDCMGKYHPHGDSSIYGALVTMVNTNESLNAPWITGQGNFGKVWAKECMRPAHMRYTEAQLSKLASEELFRGINEGAVEMIDNFDTTEKEPLILPVTFPSILVNATSGIAVGLSHNIPTYTLRNVCSATKYVIECDMEGIDVDVDTFVDLLGAPDYPTGGTISISKNQLKDLAVTGNAKGVYITGTYSANRNEITIHQIPYNTYIEKLVSELKELIKSGYLPGVKNARNSTGSHKMGAAIELSRGTDPEDVMRVVKAMTSYRTQMHYSIKFINYNSEKKDFEYKECGALELLQKYWIPWRIECIRNVYRNKVKKMEEKCHEAEVWEIIKGNIEDVVNIIRKNKRADGKQILISKYGIDLIQANYLYAKPLSSISEDGVIENIAKLNEDRKTIEGYKKYLTDNTLVQKEIIEDLARVYKKYGTDRKTNVTDLDVVERDKESMLQEEKIIEGPAWIGVTEKGYIKRTMDEDEVFKLEYWAGADSLRTEIECNNTDTLLVFTNTGYCYKLPVYRVEDSRGEFKESIWKLVERFEEDDGDIFAIYATSDYSEKMTLLYSNGEGVKLNFKYVSGPRQRYRSLYPRISGNAILYDEPEFFVVTTKGNGAWVDLNYLNKVADSKYKLGFKLPRVKTGDSIRGFVAKKQIKYFDRINLERFERDYCVKIGEDAGLIFNTYYKNDLEREKQRAEKAKAAAGQSSEEQLVSTAPTLGVEDSLNESDK